jgi:DNA-binding MarR family transcriptional regulator
MSNLAELAERTRRVFRLLKRRAQAVSGGAGAPNQTETLALGWLDEKGEMTPSALAAAQRVRPQTMGPVLDALEARSWVKRRPHPTDRRRVFISLTPPGRKALAKGRRLRQEWLVAELARLSAGDRRTLSSALTIFERFLNPENQP